MLNQLEPVYIPLRKLPLYHCGLPLALINQEGQTDWSAEYDAWGNALSETNPHNLAQLIINIFVFQTEREDTFVVDKTNVANISLMVYGGQVKQVMIRKKVLDAVIP